MLSVPMKEGRKNGSQKDTLITLSTPFIENLSSWHYAMVITYKTGRIWPNQKKYWASVHIAGDMKN